MEKIACKTCGKLCAQFTLDEAGVCGACRTAAKRVQSTPPVTRADIEHRIKKALADSDWRVLPDVNEEDPAKAATLPLWKAYRRRLRTLLRTDFDPASVELPTPPNA